jgi:hypothetical protein
MGQNNTVNDGNVQKAKEKAPLSVMGGGGETFTAQGKKYKIRPLKLKDIEEFKEDKLFIGDEQIYNLLIDETKKNLDKWTKRQVFDKDDTPVSLDMLMEHDWDLEDLRGCVRKMLRISG